MTLKEENTEVENLRSEMSVSCNDVFVVIILFFFDMKTKLSSKYKGHIFYKFDIFVLIIVQTHY